MKFIENIGFLFNYKRNWKVLEKANSAYQDLFEAWRARSDNSKLAENYKRNIQPGYLSNEYRKLYDDPEVRRVYQDYAFLMSVSLASLDTPRTL